MRHFTIRVKGNALNLYPIADVQLGAQGVDEAAFSEYVKEAARDKAGRVLGIGDYIDGVSPSNRALIESNYEEGRVYDTTRAMLEDTARRWSARFNELVRPTVGKWDVALTGHHYFKYRLPQPNGTVLIQPSDFDIAEYVGAPLVEAESLVAISYVMDLPNGKTTVFRVLLRHGMSGSTSMATPINQLEELRKGFVAHAYVTAHHHKLIAARVVKLDEAPDTETGLMATDSVIVAAGSWMRGFMPNTVTYAEAGGMTPLATGAPIIRVKARDDGSFRIRTEI